MKQITYNKDLFELLKDLSNINKQIIFDKDIDNNLVVMRADSESTIAYQLTAPKEYFDFDEAQIAFYNYPEFYQYFRTFNNPDLMIDQSNIKFRSGSSNSTYLLSNPESITAGPKSFNFNDADFKINLTSDDLDELLKMINLIDSKKAQIVCKDDKVSIKIFNNLHDNTFEKIFDATNMSKCDEEIDFVIFAETFRNLPSKRNYTIDIKSVGFIKISLIDEHMKLNVFTGRVKN